MIKLASFLYIEPATRLYRNEYMVFLSGVNRPGRGHNRPPHLDPRLKKE